jgi:hypothetical protein
VPEVSLKDPVFYEFIALCDALRVGRVREKNIAVVELKKTIILKNTQINKAAVKKIALT